ncbi:MAG: hypothetical protein DPW09_22140, partial [Anaerolineae bacterium]|nr:hypothetical protein [Anaerolineae bacterium]
MSESNTQTSLSYEEYYQRVINSQLQSDNFAGLKLVVGPTGMGKTSAIPRVIAELREKNSGKRCIYTSHRHLLIEQMESALSEVNIPSVYLRNNEEVVRAFIADNRRDDFLEKLEGSNFFDYADVPLRETRRLIGDVTKLFQSLNQLSKTEFVAAAMIQERLRRRCSELMKIFKNGLGNIAKETREELLSTDSPFWVLFPYTQFLYDPQKPVLLVTIHKLLYGFFAGHRDEGILSLSDNIIFLDEFDMQETEILSFLCRDNEIRNSFEFVRLFYEEMRDQQKLGNLTVFDDDLKAQQTAKREAVRIIQGLEKACQDNGFRFPQVSRFFLSEGEFAREALSVFQSNVLILTTPFSLLDKGLYWQIVSEKSSETLSARQLFSLIFRKAEAILEFFTILWANDLTAEWRSWIEQCYDRKNDNVAGRYQEVIREYGVFKRPIKLPKNVKDESVKESIYYKGFNFFRLRRGAYPALPDEVKIDQKTLTVSPEYILWRVCRSNLVFGLSATGDIKRYISSFDMRWLEEHCNYLVVDDEDKKLVSE